MTANRALRKRKTVRLLAWLSLASGGSVQPSAGLAQAGPVPPPGPAVLELPVSVRAQGLGGAYFAADSDSDAIFHHPAFVSGEGFGVSSRRFADGNANHLAMSASGSWFGGTVAAGMTFLEYGAPSNLFGTDDLSPGGTDNFATSEYVLAAGYATELRGFQVGGAAKLIGQRLGSARGSTAAFDLGVGRDVGPVAVALTVQNLGPDLELSGALDPDVPVLAGQDVFTGHDLATGLTLWPPPASIRLARRIVLGAATGRTPAGPLDIGAAAEIARNGEGDILPAGGVEVAWWPVLRRVFIGRVGLRRSANASAGSAASGSVDLTFGGGFAGDRIRFDYAYHAHGDDSGSHRFGLAWR